MVAVTALNQLRRCAAEREYKDVVNLVLATCELASKFENIRDIPEIRVRLGRYSQYTGLFVGGNLTSVGQPFYLLFRSY